MENIIKLQKEMQEKYFKEDLKNKDNYIFIMSYALIDETCEMLRHIPWKPWKKSSNFEEQKAKEEFIDMFIFLINIMNALKIDIKELKLLFYDKLQKNIKRQKNGY